MITAAIVWACLLSQAPANTIEYANYDTNLVFSHPKDWRIKIEKKSQAMHATLLPRSKTKIAELDVYSVVWGAKPDLWQDVQLQINKQMSRDVVRQWQEDILGMPMLLTQTHYYQKGREMEGLSALIYMQWSKKMLLRLTADVTSYSDAEVELRQALQTLHTVDGSTPVAEIPDRPITKAEAAETVTPGMEDVTVITPDPLHLKVHKGPLGVPVTVGGKAAELRFPKGWTASKTTAGFELRNPKLRDPVEIIVNSDLDSDDASDALEKATAASLNRFNLVQTRDEVAGMLYGSGSSVSWVWRVGQGSAGPICAWDAVGQIGDNYWQLAYAPEHVATKKEHALLLDLITQMSVDVITPPADKK